MNLTACLTLLAFAPGALLSQDAPLKPVTVCEVLKDSKLYDGRVVAVLGRFSYRAEGRWMGEDSCRTSVAGESAEPSDIIWLSYSPESAPRMPAGYQVDGATAAEKIQLVRKHTTLGKFRFGSSDYDRWAVVYGRFKVEPKDLGTSPPAKKVHHDAPAELLYAGDGYVMFLRDPSTQ
ncbi:MAG TPA: hypothetical protein VJN64_07690 [Terriglobales bacterium]|nr:hypothetical protein [Terriglobales bacterium]